MSAHDEHRLARRTTALLARRQSYDFENEKRTTNMIKPTPFTRLNLVHVAPA